MISVTQRQYSIFLNMHRYITRTQTNSSTKAIVMTEDQFFKSYPLSILVQKDPLQVAVTPLGVMYHTICSSYPFMRYNFRSIHGQQESQFDLIVDYKTHDINQPANFEGLFWSTNSVHISTIELLNFVYGIPEHCISDLINHQKHQTIAAWFDYVEDELTKIETQLSIHKDIVTFEQIKMIV